MVSHDKREVGTDTCSMSSNMNGLYVIVVFSFESLTAHFLVDEAQTRSSQQRYIDGSYLVHERSPRQKLMY
jgi:hypothetical protein